MQFSIKQNTKLIKSLEENGKTVLKQKLDILTQATDGKIEKVDDHFKKQLTSVKNETDHRI